MQGGLKLPTAPVQRDAYGETCQPISSPARARSPRAGAVYALSNGPWSLYASAAFYMPFAVREGPHSSDSLRSSITGQRQLSSAVATRLGFSTRLDAAGERDRQPDPTSGGLMGFVSAELVLSPVTDWVLLAGAYFPAVQALRAGTARARYWPSAPPGTTDLRAPSKSRLFVGAAHLGRAAPSRRSTARRRCQ